jgi:nickel-dependent lactate racemase
MSSVFSISIIRDLRGKVIGALAGSLEKSFYEGAKIIDATCKVQVEKKADVVFISPGGSPLDANIFDSCGCLENALKILRGRGMITLVAECFEGYGDMEFYEAISRFRNDLSSIEKSLRRKFSIGVFLAYRFLKALKEANVSMVSVIPDYYASELPGLKIFRTANEALNYALKEYGRKARVSIIPYGNHIIPAVKETEEYS